MTTIQYRTLTTRLYNTEGTDQGNRERLGYRTEDLAGLGRYGYTLLSTITVPEFDGTTIIDTLAQTDG